MREKAENGYWTAKALRAEIPGGIPRVLGCASLDSSSHGFCMFRCCDYMQIHRI